MSVCIKPNSTTALSGSSKHRDRCGRAVGVRIEKDEREPDSKPLLVQRVAWSLTCRR